MMGLVFSILTSLSFALSVSATPCTISKTAKLNCELKWSEGSDQYRLQLLTESENCAARNPESNKCGNFRLCKGNEIAGLGATTLASPNASPAFCAGDKFIDLFVSENPAGPKAYVECEKGKPKHVRLMAPDSVQSAVAKTQVCKFPLWQIPKTAKKSK
jgi:hypothetical protein